MADESTRLALAAVRGALMELTVMLSTVASNAAFMPATSDGVNDDLNRHLRAVEDRVGELDAALREMETDR